MIETLRAEILKVRRTLAFWLTVIAPLATVGIQFFWFRRYSTDLHMHPSLWRVWFEQILTLWGLVVAPCYLALQCASIAGMEHQNHAWKNLLAAPRPKWMVYAAKIGVCNLLAGLSFTLLWIFGLTGGLIQSMVRRDFPLSAAPLATAAASILAMYCASWLQLSLGAWMSLRFAQFAVPVGVAVSAMAAQVALIQTEPNIRWSPWLLPINVVAFQREYAMPAMIGLASGLTVAVLACVILARREL